MAIDSASTRQEAPLLAPRLRNVRVGLREDLEVSRHVFRGVPSYIIRDPITFQSQRLDTADYEVLVSIDATRPLSETFDALVQQGKLQADEEERFYQFVMNLHRSSFLQLPLSDHTLLYRRYQMKKQAKRREKLFGFLFLRIPLWNPNAFLDRTMHCARPLFSKVAFVLWVVLVACAGSVAVGNWDQLLQPLEGLLVTRNLVLMWFTLIVLKVFHEFGHSYACKHYGGHVPEMGIYLIVFTPCAYMDATSSWGFTRKSERLVVSLAGMYVESIVASFAVFVWAMTGATLLHSLAYNAMFLASVVTVVFNFNPLMRFDGYYILSDLLEIPNLRARSTRHVLAQLKRALLGVPLADRPMEGRLRWLLCSYGITAAAYRVILLLAIAAILMLKMFIVGMLLAVLFLGSTLIILLKNLTKYLWYADETAPVRRRAIALSLVTLVGVPAGLGLVPLPSHVHANALLNIQNETIVRVKTPGFLRQVKVEPGDRIGAGAPLALLENDAYLEDLAVAQADLQACDVRRDAYRIEEPDLALREVDRAKACSHTLKQARESLADLQVRSPAAGRIVGCLRPEDVGSFLREGDPIAMIASGNWQARAIFTADDIASTRPSIGDAVEFRAAAMPAQTFQGMVVKVAPTGSRTVDLMTLTHLGSGDITVDPETSEAPQPYFEVVVELPLTEPGPFRYGMTGTVRLRADAEPIATSLTRRLTRFVNRLMQAS